MLHCLNDQAKARSEEPYENMDMERVAFETDGFSVVVCKHPDDGRFLAVKETKRRGWWLPAGHVDSGQNFVEAAFRETMEEAGVEVNLIGILAVEHTVSYDNHARMRVIFYAEPCNPDCTLKTIPDDESECAAWMTLEDLEVNFSVAVGKENKTILTGILLKFCR